MLAVVVDDSRAMRRLLGKILADLGYEVAEAGNGQEALDLLQDRPAPELLLVDWNMPVMGGLDLVKQVRQRPELAATVVMMVTTETGIDRVGDALAAGANEYVMKPFTADAIAAKLENLGALPTRAADAAAEQTRKLRVLVVDDSAVVRRVVTTALAQETDLEIATAVDGQDGLTKVDAWSPDCVILDLEMPVLDGLATLAEIRKRTRTLPVIMFSTLTERGASITLRALAAGASAYITKPAGASDLKEATEQLRITLGEHVRSLCRRPCTGCPEREPLAAPPPVARPPRTKRQQIDVVVVASSTGGPVALAEVIPNLPADLPVPVLVVQHMPELFTAMLAKSLASKSKLRVEEGRAGNAIQPGTVWLAPGGLHMEVKKDGRAIVLATHDGPREQSVRPAADVLFRSIASTYGPNVLAVVLTGMGRDGLAGCQEIVKAGGQVIAQDEASSVVWGMPGFVARANLADAVLPIDQIAGEIVGRVTGSLANQGSARG